MVFKLSAELESELNQELIFSPPHLNHIGVQFQMCLPQNIFPSQYNQVHGCFDKGQMYQVVQKASLNKRCGVRRPAWAFSKVSVGKK